ncbi:MAG: hypothetical protein ACD_11C00105G0001 [uncultured bacterium]|nr:MAG: hypothetical protein ACD_11C00105G0001 [uncultured bacterium]
MTVSMGMPEMPGVIRELKETSKPPAIKVGFNMYTSTTSLRAMDPPTDEEMCRRLSSKPGTEF